MKIHNKFFTSLWWTEKFALLIRNEENLSDRRFMVYTPLRVALFVVLFFFVCFFLGIVASQILIGGAAGAPQEAKLKKDLTRMRQAVDSLTAQSEIQTEYLNNIKNLLGGDVRYMKTDNPYQKTNTTDTLNKRKASATSDSSQPQKIDIDYLSEADLKLRKEMESPHSAAKATLPSDPTEEMTRLYLFKPAEGIVSDKFDVKKVHLGVDIVAPQETPIKATASGTVVMASWTEDTGYVLTIQHSNGLISVYKHCLKLLKKNGQKVQKGEVIALIGNTGRITTGPHLHFELWQHGQALNPEKWIQF